MDELRVGAVGHGRGGEQVRRLALRRAGQVLVEPVAELRRRQHAAHQIRFAQARRKEIGPVRLPPGGRVRVLRVVRLRPLLDRLPQLFVAGGDRVVVGERQPERGVRVDAGADRVRLLREELDVPARDQLRERLQVRGPRLRVRVVPGVQFLRELEQPRPAVGPLERLRLPAVEVREFRLQFLRGEVLGEDGANVLRLRQIGVRAQDAREHPVPVNRGVPVVAPVERRVQFLRRLGVRVVELDVSGLVGVLLPRAREGEFGERRRPLAGERFAFRCRGRFGSGHGDDTDEGDGEQKEETRHG